MSGTEIESLEGVQFSELGPWHAIRPDDAGKPTSTTLCGMTVCPGLSMPPDEYVPCYRAGHRCPPFIAERTESETHVITSWRCPCCGTGGSTIGQPKEWAEPVFEVPVNLREGLILE